MRLALAGGASVPVDVARVAAMLTSTRSRLERRPRESWRSAAPRWSEGKSRSPDTMDDTKTGALERGEARRDAAHWSEQRPEFSGLRATSPGGWSAPDLIYFTCCGAKPQWKDRGLRHIHIDTHRHAHPAHPSLHSGLPSFHIQTSPCTPHTPKLSYVLCRTPLAQISVHPAHPVHPHTKLYTPRTPPRHTPCA